jgi:hypothetical protein
MDATLLPENLWIFAAPERVPTFGGLLPGGNNHFLARIGQVIAILVTHPGYLS